MLSLLNGLSVIKGQLGAARLVPTRRPQPSRRNGGGLPLTCHLDLDGLATFLHTRRLLPTNPPRFSTSLFGLPEQSSKSWKPKQLRCVPCPPPADLEAGRLKSGADRLLPSESPCHASLLASGDSRNPVPGLGVHHSRLCFVPFFPQAFLRRMEI